MTSPRLLRAPRTRRALAPVALALLAAAGACTTDEDPFAVDRGGSDLGAPEARFRLPEGAGERTDVRTAPAGPATLARELALPGRLLFDADRSATVAARLDGIVAEVLARPGQDVQRGQVLAVLHSRELARARSAYVEAAHRREFAEVTFRREERLWEKRITPEDTYLRARSDLEHAAIDLQTAGQELRALGADTSELEALGDVSRHVPDGSGGLPWEAELNRFELRTPIAGRVLAKDAVLGEAVHAEDTLFEVADLDTLWLDLSVRSSDLPSLPVGTLVEVESRALGRELVAPIEFVDPRIDSDTQTALARVVVDNAERAWYPGLFVEVRARVGAREVPVAVPLAAVHRSASSESAGPAERVFVALPDGSWEARAVRLGASDGERVEVLEGLAAGEQVAVTEGLLLKSTWLGHGGLED